MPAIEVDFDVFKAITARRSREDVTANDVLRELLHLPPAEVTSRRQRPAAGDWVPKGVKVPTGSELRAHYKGQLHLAEVSSGALVLNGKRFDSPSAAAMSITRHPVNGWTFWEVRLPGQGRWTRLKDLRSRGS